MKFQVRTYSLPRWIVPLLFLAALALVPFALMLALGVAALALGATVVRGFFLSPGQSHPEEVIPGRGGNKIVSNGKSVIEADFEARDENEENQRG